MNSQCVPPLTFDNFPVCLNLASRLRAFPEKVGKPGEAKR